jgi:hypothetical protein
LKYNKLNLTKKQKRQLLFKMKNQNTGKGKQEVAQLTRKFLLDNKTTTTVTNNQLRKPFKSIFILAKVIIINN